LNNLAWKYPSVRSCVLDSKGAAGAFVSFESRIGGELPVSVENNCKLTFFSSSLRYRIEIIGKGVSLSIYSNRFEFGDDLYLAADVGGKLLRFTDKVVEVQGLDFIFIKSDSNDFSVEITSLEPIQLFDYSLGNKCLTDGANICPLYELRRSTYWVPLPFAEITKMLEDYKQWILSESIGYPDQRLLVNFQSQNPIELTLKNRSTRPGSYLFVPLVVSEYATYDTGDGYEGIKIPNNKKAIISLGELHFVYRKSHQDGEDWEFLLETGSVHHYSIQKRYSLIKTKTGYRLPDIVVNGLTAFTFSITNLGVAKGIKKLILDPICSIQFTS
jgi:hypothetical protein